MTTTKENFDTETEWYFAEWCREAKKHGYIKDWEYHSESFLLSPKQTYNQTKKLKTKTKVVTRHLLHPHSYTPDFQIYITEKFIKDFPKHGLLGVSDSGSTYIDIKLGNYVGFKNNSGITFPINQKWTYEKYRIYVNKIMPSKFFAKTWCPASVYYTSYNKPRKQYENCKVIK